MQTQPPSPSEPLLLSAPEQWASVGNASELTVAIPYDGLTPHAWTSDLGPGLTERSSRRLAAGDHGAGSGGAQLFVIDLGQFHSTEARFTLATPWDSGPRDVRVLHITRD
jgi:hypothetical protein